MGDGLKQNASDNVITTEEACIILKRSRQQLNNLINKDEIDILKRTTNGNFFWKRDIYKLSQKINRVRTREKHEIIDITAKTFNELDINAQEIAEIYVFNDYLEAICKNFYNIQEIEVPDSLTLIKGIKIAIILKNNVEYWFDDITFEPTKNRVMDYSIQILDELGVQYIEGVDVKTILRENKWVYFYKYEDKWMYEGKSALSCEEYISNSEISFKEHFFKYNDKLIMVSKKHTELNYLSLQDVFDFSSFLPEPICIEFLSKEEAINTGHYTILYGETIIYSVVIRDFSEREIWFSYSTEKINEKKQFNIKELMERLGISERIIESNIPERINRWLEIKPRNIYRI